MATKTSSPVTRITEPMAVLYPRPRPVAVTICRLSDSDVLEFREVGRRARFRLTVESAFRYAVQLSTMRIARRVKELRKTGLSKTAARKQAEKEYLK